MSNQVQFACQTAAVLMASGLIASLLPGFASAQDQSARVARSTFFVGGPNASDTNPGTAAAPFATIQKAAILAQPGDVVKIRDGVYRETVTPVRSGTKEEPIIFMADTRPDGTLCEPVISGADLLTTNWTLASHVNLPGVDPVSKPIYETTISLPATDPSGNTGGNEVLLGHQIFVRSKMVQLARWPKVTDLDHPMQGYGHARALDKADLRGPWQGSVQGNTITLRDNGLPNIPGGWTKGRFKMMRWYIAADGEITGSGNHEIQIGDGATRQAFSQVMSRMSNNEPDQLLYYVYGVLGALTAEGEWFYDAGTHRLFLWAPGGGVPQHVEYKARNWGFDLTGKSHITMKHLNFFACDIPTNGDSLWPSNASNWPEVRAKAAAEDYVAGAAPLTKNNPATVPAPSNGVVIDHCRFKYLNHTHTLVDLTDRLSREISEVGIQQGNSNTNYGNFHRAGIRITGDGCTIKNSVFDTCALNGILVTGKDCLIQNNYFKDINYCGTWASGVYGSVVAQNLRILGNTFWRTGRCAITNTQRLAQVGFNDMSQYCYLSTDGGANYSQARFVNVAPHGHPWNARQYSFYYGENLLARKERPAQKDQLDAYAFEGHTFHHNWSHDARGYKGLHCTQAGVYFDDATDGVIIHHNVCWNNYVTDMRAPNASLNYAATPLGIHLVYNNTYMTAYGTQAGGVPGVSHSTQTFTQAAQCRWTIQNNIYRLSPPSPGLPTELGVGSNVNNIFLDPDSAYTSSPANGKPWLIGFGPGQHPSGLGFTLKSGSNAINKGVLVSTIESAPGVLGHDSLGRPLDYIDDPMNGPKPDVGAYEFNGPQVPGAPRYYDNPGHPAHGAWIPGCTLPREFIEGQPWDLCWLSALPAGHAGRHGDPSADTYAAVPAW